MSQKTPNSPDPKNAKPSGLVEEEAADFEAEGQLADELTGLLDEIEAAAQDLDPLGELEAAAARAREAVERPTPLVSVDGGDGAEDSAEGDPGFDDLDDFEVFEPSAEVIAQAQQSRGAAAAAADEAAPAVEAADVAEVEAELEGEIDALLADAEDLLSELEPAQEASQEPADESPAESEAAAAVEAEALEVDDESELASPIEAAEVVEAPEVAAEAAPMEAEVAEAEVAEPEAVQEEVEVQVGAEAEALDSAMLEAEALVGEVMSPEDLAPEAPPEAPPETVQETPQETPTEPAEEVVAEAAPDAVEDAVEESTAAVAAAVAEDAAEVGAEVGEAGSGGAVVEGGDEISSLDEQLAAEADSALADVPVPAKEARAGEGITEGVGEDEDAGFEDGGDAESPFVSSEDLNDAAVDMQASAVESVDGKVTIAGVEVTEEDLADLPTAEAGEAVEEAADPTNPLPAPAAGAAEEAAAEAVPEAAPAPAPAPTPSKAPEEAFEEVATTVAVKAKDPNPVLAMGGKVMRLMSWPMVFVPPDRRELVGLVAAVTAFWGVCICGLLIAKHLMGT